MGSRAGKTTPTLLEGPLKVRLLYLPRCLYQGKARTVEKCTLALVSTTNKLAVHTLSYGYTDRRTHACSIYLGVSIKARPRRRTVEGTLALAAVDVGSLGVIPHALVPGHGLEKSFIHHS